ncbi:MAG TPA: Do family serine endopeptidase [Sphingomonadaceae bacterium]
MKPVRYAYGISSALLIGGAAFSLATGYPAGAQEAQNEPSKIQSVMPRSGAPASFAGLVDQLQPAVVGIQTRQQVKVNNGQGNNPLFNFFFGPDAQPQQPRTQTAHALGSGFLISSDGYIVTNNHVITAEGQGVATSITVTLFDGTEYPATIVGQDDYSDIAVLKIKASKPLPFVKFGQSANARAGDWVLAIGNPFGLASTVTAGIVSSAHRHAGPGAYNEYIQTDASINPGNSGGPMFDMNGNVIGINRWIVSPNGGGNVGIGFAIPSEVARPIVDKLIHGQAIERGYLGAQFSDVSEDMADALGLPHGKGQYAEAVVPNDPADKAGLQRGDIVTAVNGEQVTEDQSLAAIMAQTKPGTRVTLSVIRQGKPMTLNVTVGTRPSSEELSKKDFGGFSGQSPDNDNGGPGDSGAYFEQSLGLHVMAVTPRVAQQLGLSSNATGVVITSIEDGSGAADTPLDRGMIITSVNYKTVTSTADFHAAVAAAERSGRNAVLLHVQAPSGQSADVAVRVDSGKTE